MALIKIIVKYRTNDIERVRIKKKDGSVNAMLITISEQILLFKHLNFHFGTNDPYSFKTVLSFINKSPKSFGFTKERKNE